MKPTLTFLNFRPSQHDFRGHGALGSVQAATLLPDRASRKVLQASTPSPLTWWQTYRLLWRHLFARLAYNHTQIPFWERRPARLQLRADVRRACYFLDNHKYEDALAALPAHRAPPNEAFCSVAASVKHECATRQ